MADLSKIKVGGTTYNIKDATARTETQPVARGGTGATDAATARENLGITPSNIGAAASSHDHNASNINAGTLSSDRLPTVPASKGGTGKTTLKDSASALANALDTETTTPQDADYFVVQTAGGGTTTTTYKRKSLSSLWAWIKAKADSVYAAKSHTHNYAGSSSAGGAATSANKINTDAGSGTQPVYFENGVPKATTYALNKTVPSNAKFTDTTYDNFVKSGTGAKAGLVPSPGTAAGTEKYLREDGTWVKPPNTTYGVATQSANGLQSAADKTKLDGIATGANKTVVDTALSDSSTNPVQNKVINTALAGKAPSSHNHNASNINAGTLSSDRLPTVPVSKGGTGATTAEDARTNLGVAASSHNHAASNITSGTLSSDRLPTVPASKGGTGKTTLKDSANALINGLTTESTTPADTDYFVSQTAGGTATTFHRRPLSALWAWIKAKIASDYNGMALETLLWENQTPSLDFAGQAIDLDTTGYDSIKIAFKGRSSVASSNGGGTLELKLVGETGQVIVQNVAKMLNRMVTWTSNSKITFGDCSIANTYGSTSGREVMNGYMIPVKIYGVKVVRNAEITEEEVVIKDTLPINRGGTGAITAAGARANLGVKDAVTETLLWTNASPGSNFAAQTISLDLSGYDRVLIKLALSTSYTQRQTYFLMSIEPYYIPITEIYNHTGVNLLFNYREVIARTNNVQFKDAYYRSAGGSSTTDNGALIPVEIYGIKVVD